MATTPTTAVFRHSRWDALLVFAAVAQGIALLLWPSIPLIALGLWWCANTVSHNFIHLPFFRSRAANTGFSIYLSLLLGFPQTLWRQRHLAHHAEAPFQSAIRNPQSAIIRASSPPSSIPIGSGLRRTSRLLRLMTVELACVAALWCALLVFAPRFFVTTYLPGWLIGLVLCQLQGHYEHARGTTSHYGRIYNFLFFNDGYHIEHHHRPAQHWREIPKLSAHAAPLNGSSRLALRSPDPIGTEDGGDEVSFQSAIRNPQSAIITSSRWPAVLRWLDCFNLESLERCVLRSTRLQRIVVAVHERAFRKLIGRLPTPRRVAVVGGALFPRTAILLQHITPQSRIVIIDANHDHILQAKKFLNGTAEYQHRLFDSRDRAEDFDVVVIPLSFRGDRDALYEAPPARALLIHDWLWRRRGSASAVVSPWLLKRVNLVLRPELSGLKLRVERKDMLHDASALNSQL